MASRSPRVAFYIPSFERGGIERFVINIATELTARGVDLDVLTYARSTLVEEVDDSATIVELSAPRLIDRGARAVLPPHVANALASLPSYVSYLRRVDPDVVVSLQTNPFAIAGVRLARSTAAIVVRESNTPSVATADQSHRIGRLAPLAKRLTYPRADAVVAVSRAAARDVATGVGVDPDSVETIYNPTYTDDIVDRALEGVEHPFYRDEIPVVASVGRLSDQKDFETLLAAFARLIEDRPARLVVVGDGENREMLEERTRELEIDDYVSFVGYRENPYPWVAGADLFVLSSRYEGLPNALIEAIGLATPAVATDCPSGPSEILLDGEGGDLVPVGDEVAMAEAIDSALSEPERTRRQLRRAHSELDRFRPGSAADRYLSLADRTGTDDS